MTPSAQIRNPTRLCRTPARQESEFRIPTAGFRLFCIGSRNPASSLLKNAPGEGTGPTGRRAFRGIPLGRVPSRGAQEVFQQAARGDLLIVESCCNPKGIESSSPGLRGTSYPGWSSVRFSTPTGLCRPTTSEPQPRWGCLVPATFPGVARVSQPRALGRNPFGIHFRNFREALFLAGFSNSDSKGVSSLWIWSFWICFGFRISDFGFQTS
jgi:hypothetical protein